MDDVVVGLKLELLAEQFEIVVDRDPLGADLFR